MALLYIYNFEIWRKCKFDDVIGSKYLFSISVFSGQSSGRYDVTSKIPCHRTVQGIAVMTSSVIKITRHGHSVDFARFILQQSLLEPFSKLLSTSVTCCVFSVQQLFNLCSITNEILRTFVYRVITWQANISLTRPEFLCKHNTHSTILSRIHKSYMQDIPKHM